MRAVMGFMAGLVAGPANSRQRARLHVPRVAGWTVADAAQAVLLHPQNLGCRFVGFLPPRTGGGFPFRPTRLVPAVGGVEGSRRWWRPVGTTTLPVTATGRRGRGDGIVRVCGEKVSQLLYRP